MNRHLTVNEIANVHRQYPAVFKRPLKRRLIQWVVWIGFAAFTIYCLVQLGFFSLGMIGKGLGKLYGVVSFMLPPAAHGRFLDFLRAVFETLGMAFLGTLLAALLAIPMGFLGSKNMNVNPIFHFALRRQFDFIRGIDALIWALVWINVVGLGPFAGILAIGCSVSGELAKLFSEAIENVDRKQIEGVRASGANTIQTMRFAILPQVFPVILSTSLYYFESNTRSATILGIVGAGGIGLHLSDRIRVLAWDQASLIICMILVTVYLIDTLSNRIRHHFITAREIQ
ncbi:MAG: phosphonate ABC transporter, permease protein PhnE [Desulfobacteraceae bacterium]|jgi:phosphonate transport system permease protein|nr:phosphonate ABC transporter, permease protein PhnE [Desulfobacteraceae bacterium]